MKSQRLASVWGIRRYVCSIFRDEPITWLSQLFKDKLD